LGTQRRIRIATLRWHSALDRVRKLPRSPREQGNAWHWSLEMGPYQHARHLKNWRTTRCGCGMPCCASVEVRKGRPISTSGSDQVMPEFAEMATGAEIALVISPGTPWSCRAFLI
jgi:hypothetical protein